MATVDIDGDTLVVEIEGLDRLWALRSRLEIPLANVRGATIDPGVIKEPKGVRTAGTHLPGVITAGSFRVGGDRVFWDVRDPAKTIVIELRDDRYVRLIIQVPDPHAAVTLIEGAITRRRAS
jgi:hypothetical protein